MSDVIYLNNITTTTKLTLSDDSENQIRNILKQIDSKIIFRNNLRKLTIYYIDRDSYESIYRICEEWKPLNFVIEYIGNYMNYNPLIKVMASAIALAPIKEDISYSNSLDTFERVNYII